MGSGISQQRVSAPNSAKISPLNDTYPTKVFIGKVLVKAKLFSEANQWENRRLKHTGGV